MLLEKTCSNTIHRPLATVDLTTVDFRYCREIFYTFLPKIRGFVTNFDDTFGAFFLKTED